jgi:hypothetical protein
MMTYYLLYPWIQLFETGCLDDEQNINKVNLTQLLSNVEKQDENNISASAKTQDNNQQRIKIKTLEVRI